MKKICKIFGHSLIAMAVASMTFAPVAHAALGDLYIDTEVNNEPVFFEDFETTAEGGWTQETWNATHNVYGNQNSYTPADYVGNKSRNAGVYIRSTAQTIAFADRTDDGGAYAVKGANMFVKVPEFFKDKGPGVYSIELDIKNAGTKSGGTHTKNLMLQRLNIAETANSSASGGGGGGARFIKDAEGFNQYRLKGFANSNTFTEFKTVRLDLYYGGSVTDFVNSSHNNTYDKYALVLLLTTEDVNSEFLMDNIKIYWTDKADINTYAGKEINVKTTVYNNTSDTVDAKLITAIYNADEEMIFEPIVTDITVTEAKTEYIVPVALPGAADNNWKVRTYLWSADGNIEAFCDENILFAQYNKNTGLEVLDGTSETGLLGWEPVANEAASALSENSYGGVYSIKIPAGSTDGIKQDVTSIMSSYGAGDYMLTAWVKSDASTTAKIGFGATLDQHAVGTEWQKLVYEFNATTTSLSGNISIANAGAGTLYIDDVVFTKITE